MSSKSETLYAYTVESNALTTDACRLYRDLKSVLASEEKATLGDRRMVLSHRSTDSDVLSFYTIGKSYIFGAMITLSEGGASGAVPNEILQKNSLNTDELTPDEIGALRYRGIYYFAITESTLIINDSRMTKRLGSYLNWMLESQRGDTLYSFDPIVKIHEQVELSNVSSIVFSSGINLELSPQGSYLPENARKSFELSNSLFPWIKKKLAGDTELIRLLDEGVLHAQVVLKVSTKRPEGRTKEDHKKLLSASLSTDENVTFVTKKGKDIKGASTHLFKSVSIDRTENNHLIEEALKQEMERFISEIQDT